MNIYRKNTGLVLMAFVLGLAAFPISYSEAQSANVSFSPLECEVLGGMPLEGMNVRQLELSKECDMFEASHDWEQMYGNFNEQELVMGVVYE
ncbi:hypothetical protein L4G92_06935 [Neisseria sp. ZJ106]|uniref:Secreted protein n=1 Tax=Neisseria lisongii TaxID=2912188 RepID=A0AAW5API4_9NEIS|nr:hypothetical protein [Neisseria lisongii]MCF7521780.1 hypothetical protein [Neisseria lisongii]MCF7530409.1 hypothetical protein [Neisseria lisongii]WCL70983.1 hypothetical protein PJU73_06365 [Neisseria lisongii]